MTNLLLSEKELAHIKTGNRIFVVQRVKDCSPEDQLWNIAIVKDESAEISSYIPDEFYGYDDPNETVGLAECFALVSKDQPIVIFHD